jgi:hypothetical protein
MPSDDGLELEKQQDFLPAWPEAQQANPNQAIGGAESGFVRLSFEHSELMSERQVFNHEPGMGSEAGEQRPQEGPRDIEHDGVNFGRRC